MPPKKRVGRPKKTMQGKGPVLDWLKKAGSTVHRFVKDNRLISKGLGLLAPVAGSFAPAVAGASGIAHTLGYGKKKGKGKKKVGKPRKRPKK